MHQQDSMYSAFTHSNSMYSVANDIPNIMDFQRPLTISPQSSFRIKKYNLSKSLYMMNTRNLSLMVKYIIENEDSFSKYRYHSISIYNSFMNYKIKGKMLINLTKHEFGEELPCIRNIIAAELYDHLTGLSDSDIHSILNQCLNSKDVEIVIPDYLTLRDINLSFAEYNVDEFRLFVYTLLQINKYDSLLCELLMKALMQSECNGEQFLRLKRSDFCRTLKGYDIKAAVASKVYKLIKEHSGNVTQYLDNYNIQIIRRDKDNKIIISDIETDPDDAEENESDFGHFVHHLCYRNEMDDNTVESVLKAVDNLDVKQFCSIKRVEFCNLMKSHGIRGGVATKLYRLIIQNMSHMDEYMKLESRSKNTLNMHGIWDSTNSGDTVSNISNKFNISKDNSGASSLNSDDLNRYNESVVDQLVSLGYGTRDECIYASSFTINYWDINDVMDTLNGGKRGLATLNKSELEIFIYNVCCMNSFDSNDIDNVLSAISAMAMNGKGFIGVDRSSFGRKLREYNIKGAVAAKLYKLIVENSNDIAAYINIDRYNSLRSAEQMSDIALSCFQRSAYKMLKNMNNSMKLNKVNGDDLINHYEYKLNLEQYLRDNVRSKSVNVLCNMLWSDYLRNKEEMKAKISSYDRKQLLKYFISLFMYHLKSTICRHNINENKCVSLNRKRICTIIMQECGFSIGTATNIVDTMYSKLQE